MCFSHMQCRALALKLHPDKAGASLGTDFATALFSLLSAAHATLSGAQSRRLYDLELLRQKYTSPLARGRQQATDTTRPTAWATGWT